MPNPTLRSTRHGRAGRPPSEVATLVQRAAAGEERAWHALVEEFGNLVWAVARSHRLSDADAAEVTQSTWTHLVENAGRLNDPTRVGAWLATTARRECLRVLRHGARLVPCGDVGHDQIADAPEHGATLITEERDVALWQAFE
jgi:RNA polymerase sigma factor (sigma-70 family)